MTQRRFSKGALPKKHRGEDLQSKMLKMRIRSLRRTRVAQARSLGSTSLTKLLEVPSGTMREALETLQKLEPLFQQLDSQGPQSWAEAKL